MLNVDRSALWAQEVRNWIFKKEATWQPLAAATWGKCLRVAASGCQVAAKWLLEHVAAKWLQVSAKWLLWQAAQVAASGCRWLQVAA